MLLFNVEGFPELTIRAFATLKRQLIPLIEQYDHLFDIEEETDSNTVIKLRTKRSFYFTLFQAKKQINGPEYLIPFSVTPHRKVDLSGHVGNLLPNQIVEEFKKWIGLISSYEEALNEFQNPFDEQTDNEINELFNFLPEEGDDVGNFDIPTILRLEQILNKVSAQIKGKADIGNPEIQKLLKDIDEIKAEVPQKTRSIIKKRLSKLFSGMKKKAWPSFKWLLEETVKEVIKETIKGNIPLSSGNIPF